MIQSIDEGKDDLRYHKLAEDNDYTKKSYAFFNKKLVRTVEALFFFDNTNLFNWESIVIPMLRLEGTDVGEKKVEIKVAKD